MQRLKNIENVNIVQSNFLIENRPKMTKNELRLFITIISMINKNDSDFDVYEIPVLNFIDLWGLDAKSAYGQVKKALIGLADKKFYLEEIDSRNKKQFIVANYISSGRYSEGDGVAIVEISKCFKPYLLELKNNYTLYILKNVLKLNSVYSIRTYELLKQFESLQKRVFTIDEYKSLLGIQNKYDNYDLKRKVLDPSKSEINKLTDLTIDYTLTGRGKKAKIEFYITKKEKDTKKIVDYSTLKYPLLSECFPIFSEVEIEALYNASLQNLKDKGNPDTWELAVIDYIRPKYNKIQAKKDTKNLFNLLLSYVQNNY